MRQRYSRAQQVAQPITSLDVVALLRLRDSCMELMEFIQWGGGEVTKVYASGATANFLSWGLVTLGLLGFCTHRGGGAGYRWCSVG